ncbi:hypothetical protein GH714_018218 [Hevea brasiliensis]|uniref:Uncharacterized protein n=1 Tax=Hevea brasiliensis TaxID=3981 RepID=A0A6A6N0V6_HEVBR|nr:hypothetical protein GH714_018218 [Hevea brasiliensis]
MLLQGCCDLKNLPSEMQNLINLRHLDIRWTALKVMPQGMEKLRSLRTLSDFVVGEGNEVGITALENLKFLRGHFAFQGDPLFRNLVCLELENCNCTTLPQLGLLSSLKDLVIKGFPSVRAVDREFCWGSMSSSNPFPALETLRFEDMEEWKEWNICV